LTTSKIWIIVKLSKICANQFNRWEGKLIRSLMKHPKRPQQASVTQAMLKSSLKQMNHTNISQLRLQIVSQRIKKNWSSILRLSPHRPKKRFKVMGKWDLATVLEKIHLSAGSNRTLDLRASCSQPIAWSRKFLRRQRRLWLRKLM
jgi:hypothetical protein